MKSEDNTLKVPEIWEFVANDMLNRKFTLVDGSIDTKTYKCSYSSSNGKSYITVLDGFPASFEVRVDNSNMILSFEMASDQPLYAKRKSTYNFSKK